MAGTSCRRMEGKRVLVTGAGTGIGGGVAEAFAAEGARVAIHYSHSRKGADELAARLRADGASIEAFGADFTKIDEVRSLADRAIGWLGGIDVLVNNAGITMNIPFEEVKVEQFDTVYGVNIRAMFFLTQACAAPMVRQGRGVVINMSSLHAFGGMRAYTVYAGTKGAIVTFTRTLAIELAPRGIRVNADRAGPVVVDNDYKADPDYDPVAKGQMIPAGSRASPPTSPASRCSWPPTRRRYIYRPDHRRGRRRHRLLVLHRRLQEAVGDPLRQGYAGIE